MCLFVLNMAKKFKSAIVVRLTQLETFNKDKHQLKSIIKEHVKSTDNAKTIQLHALVEPIKLLSQFNTRPKKDTLQQSHVVYRYKCLEDGCNTTYIGYTTCTLATRATQHKYKTSSIYKHSHESHSKNPNQISDFSSNFEIIYKINEKLGLQIAEAIAIKQENPAINIKYNELSNYFNIYK